MKDEKEEKKKPVRRITRNLSKSLDSKDEEVKTTARKRVTRTKKEAKEEKIEIIKKSVEFSLMEVIIIVIITGIAVSIASGIIVYNNYDKLNFDNYASSLTGNDELDEFYDNYNKIVNNYVEEVDKKELIEAAISGMYNYLGDEYSMYLDQEDTSDLSEQLNGEYTGIGIEITTLIDENEKQYVEIHRVFKDSPAEEAGLKAGDIITKIDGVSMNDASQISNTIKNGKKESYEITYIRDGKENTLTLTRKKVFINSVSSEEYDNVGYIKIETFSATTVNQVLELLDGFDDNITSLVIDLRNNTGGYLDTAYNLSDLFLEKGKVVYQLKGRDNKVTKYRAENGVYKKFDKIVVLINENSASASEILTLALKESAGAVVVGNRSFGKGTVQETGSLSSGSMIKYTTSYWLSPNGKSINKIGIEPDIKVTETDKQLDEAIKAAK